MRIPGEVYKKVCIVCGKNFIARRSHAKCCSATCRTVLSRDDDADAKEVVFKSGGAVKVMKDFIDQAIPEDEWNKTLQVLCKRLVDAGQKHGKKSEQYKSALEAIHDFNPPRILSDGSIYLGNTRLK